MAIDFEYMVKKQEYIEKLEKENRRLKTKLDNITETVCQVIDKYTWDSGQIDEDADIIKNEITELTK